MERLIMRRTANTVWPWIDGLTQGKSRERSSSAVTRVSKCSGKGPSPDGERTNWLLASQEDLTRTYLINGSVAEKPQNLCRGNRRKVMIWLSFDSFTS